MGGLLRRLGLAVLTGYIFVYFSEYAFWARPLDGVRFPDVVWLMLFYSTAAYVFLALVATFRARTLAAVFLAGALFGWLDEGIFVQTMYGSLPLSISFTGLAWHALLTVLVGWLAVQRALRGGWWRMLRVSALIGLGYGLWAIWWWVDAPPPIPLATFATYAFLTTLPLMLAYWLASRPSLLRFAPSRAELIVVGILILVYFGLVTVPAVPLALVILPPLALLVLLTLGRNRRVEARANALLAFGEIGPFRRRNLLALLALPTTASLVYALAQAADVRIPTGWAYYIVTTGLGFILLIYAGVKIWRTKRPNVSDANATAATPDVAVQVAPTMQQM